MQPFVVSRVTDSNGKVVKENGPRPVRRVISRKTAAQVKEIMQSVVSNDGTGRNAMIPGYSVAGKTGTAQKVDPISKTYSDDKVVVVFAGFAPASDPKLAILVVLDEPEGRAFGGTVAAPAFRNVMKTALQEMGVRPEPDVQMASAPVQTARPQVPVPEVKENTSATEVPHGSKNLMPDLQGKDMRAVLRWAQQAKMRIHVKGSGWTVAQEPKPGESLEQGQVCQVIFQQGPNGR